LIGFLRYNLTSRHSKKERTAIAGSLLAYLLEPLSPRGNRRRTIPKQLPKERGNDRSAFVRPNSELPDSGPLCTLAGKSLPFPSNDAQP
jgi:hypothetical protein